MNLEIGIRVLRNVLPADATNALNRLTISEGDHFMGLKLECAHRKILKPIRGTIKFIDFS